MHAKFPIRPGLEVEVQSNTPRRVVEVTIVANLDESSKPRRDTISLSPSTARALSSAIVGAAAEV